MKAAHPEVLAATRVNPGETLRQARESNGWSLAEVALKLNLTASSLSNLEAGAFDKLPGHTFARGYIRAYAKLLGMDQAVLVRPSTIHGHRFPGQQCAQPGPYRRAGTGLPHHLRIVSLLLLIAVIGGGFIWWQDQTSVRTKELISLNQEHVEVEGPTAPRRFIRSTNRKTRRSWKARPKAKPPWLCLKPRLQARPLRMPRLLRQVLRLPHLLLRLLLLQWSWRRQRPRRAPGRASPCSASGRRTGCPGSSNCTCRRACSRRRSGTDPVHSRLLDPDHRWQR